MASSGNRADMKIKHKKEPSDEFEDFGDDTYSQSTLQQRIAPRPVEEDIPDTTMLDSVILPAIASVSSV
jgi:serine/threonine-protein kinase 24/25/MST4